MTERRSIELGGITVDLLRIGTFRSDAGAIFGPVPQETWAPIVAGEIDGRSRLLQALNILHVSDANGGVLLETGAVPAGALVRDADTDSQSAREALVAAGLDVEGVNARYGRDLWAEYGGELERFREAGLLNYDGRRLRLTRPGMLLANEIMSVFVGSSVVD